MSDTATAPVLRGVRLSGRDVRLLRSARGWSQGELGAKTGLYAPAISAIEKGHQPLTREMELRLVRALWPDKEPGTP
ncbi:MAG: hypothetical protein A3G44_15620 [Candidatus Rokubacteria bacterium RIFCSPLOWO2_12_FULL_73_47]|nr:MAG: hypothetical protein A3G44_15620 [Candidatus Rokubacteria bacterium RIFCSPLOWO2_12_FULL_73_47]